MAVRAWACCKCLIIFILLPLNGFQLIMNVESENSSEQPLLPPSSLNVVEVDRFNLRWTWLPSKNTLINRGCNLMYHSKINDNTASEIRSINLQYSLIKGLYSNDKVCLKVRAECGNRSDSYGESKWIERCTFLSEGDPDTSVTNFSCLWYDEEYMNCTWQPGKSAPPDTSYILYRYEKPNNSHLCQEYIYKDRTAIGCHFSKAELPKGGKVHFMVTDPSERLRSLYSYVDLESILKPSAPRITNISKISDGEIYVSWNKSWHIKDHCLLSEVEYKENKFNIVRHHNVCRNLSSIFPSNCFPDVRCTVRVRTKIQESCSESKWSDWSQEKSFGNDSDGHMIYLLAIPLVAVATIILLIHLKRLQNLIFPPIPDPGKMFKNMFGDWQWIKYNEANVFSKTVKEETCYVFLLENPNSSSSENSHK